jgi:formylglycine-generating enzyme required for sulfatase activity
MRDGERFVTAGNWAQARREFEAALRMYPNHRRASERLSLAKRRMDPRLPGFEPVGDRFHAETGLPLYVRVVGMPIEMALIPGGDADIGDDNLPGSRPAHTVTLQPFYLALTELTQRSWLLLERDNPSSQRGGEIPVHNVSWNDAQRWLAALNKRVSGGGFRLPTEAEWEFAARSGSIQHNPGAGAWFRENSAAAPASGGFRQIDAYTAHPVGSLRPDARGIFDLAGNVWEWCSTLLRPYPYDPRDGREASDAPGIRVLRGGGFADSADYLKPAFRHADRPDRRLLFNGLRVARTVPPN